MNTTKIAAALRALADAIEEPDVTTASKPKEIEEEVPWNDDTVKEVTLEDLQELGASLLRAKKRGEFLAVLKSFDLKNLSGADEAIYPELWEALKAA